MNISALRRPLLTRFALSAALLALPAAAFARSDDPLYDEIERYAKIGADQARELHRTLVKIDPVAAKRSGLLEDSRLVMVGYSQLRVQAKIERPDRMSNEAAKLHDALVHFEEHLGDFAASQPGWSPAAGEYGRVQAMAHSLHERVAVIEAMIADLGRGPIGYAPVVEGPSVRGPYIERGFAPASVRPSVVLPRANRLPSPETLPPGRSYVNPGVELELNPAQNPGEIRFRAAPSAPLNGGRNAIRGYEF